MSPGQINYLVPYDIASSGTAEIQVVRKSTSEILAAGTVNLAQVSPALFVQGGAEQGPVAAINQDGTVNTPVIRSARGQYISLFATGMGAVSGAPAEGTPPPGPAPASEFLRVLINTEFVKDEDIQYFGLAPESRGCLSDQRQGSRFRSPCSRCRCGSPGTKHEQQRGHRGQNLEDHDLCKAVVSPSDQEELADKSASSFLSNPHPNLAATTPPHVTAKDCNIHAQARETLLARRPALLTFRRTGVSNKPRVPRYSIRTRTSLLRTAPDVTTKGCNPFAAESGTSNVQLVQAEISRRKPAKHDLRRLPGDSDFRANQRFKQTAETGSYAAERRCVDFDKLPGLAG